MLSSVQKLKKSITLRLGPISQTFPLTEPNSRIYLHLTNSLLYDCKTAPCCDISWRFFPSEVWHYHKTQQQTSQVNKLWLL